jgi:hypothetical protein
MEETPIRIPPTTSYMPHSKNGPNFYASVTTHAENPRSLQRVGPTQADAVEEYAGTTVIARCEVVENRVQTLCSDYRL